MKMYMQLRRVSLAAHFLAAGAPDAELVIYGDIGDSWFGQSVTAADVVDQLKGLKAQHLLARINSFGGSVTDGTAIYNAIRALGIKITTRIEGIAASIASLIAMAGDQVEIYANAMFMVHAPWTGAMGNSADLRETADVLDTFAKAMATSYARKTGRTADEELPQLTDGQDHWYTAADAKAAGYVDTIIDEPAAQPPDEAAARAEPVLAAMARYRSMPKAVVASAKSFFSAALARRNPTAASAASQRKEYRMLKALARSLGLNPDDFDSEAALQLACARKLGLAENASEQDILNAYGNRERGPPNNGSGNPNPGTGTGNGGGSGNGAQPTAAALRRQSIESMFDVAAHANPDDAMLTRMRAAALIDEARPESEIRTELLAYMANGATPIAGQHAVRVNGGQDESEKRREAMTVALLARMGRATNEQRAALGANPYRGHRMLDLAASSLEAAGQNVRGMSRSDIAEYALGRRDRFNAAQTTSDFPVVLENTLHKIMLDGYAAASPSWQLFCKTIDVSDFRNWDLLIPGALGNLEGVNEAGEYKNKSIPDATKNSIQASRRGNILEVTPELLVNDDIGYIMQMAESAGQAGARTVESVVYATLNSNPVLKDGYALFSAQHGNLVAQGSGAAPSMAGVNAMVVAMKSQKLPGDTDDYMDLAPKLALTSLSTEGPLRQIIQSPFDPDAANKLQRPNIVYNAVETIKGSPRIAVATAWYMFADPNTAPVMVVAFLDGQRTPVLKQGENYRTGGLWWRVEFPFGVGVADYRGAQKNYGA